MTKKIKYTIVHEMPEDRFYAYKDHLCIGAEETLKEAKKCVEKGKMHTEEVVYSEEL